ncbi:sulfotransferase [Ruegeria sp. 2012CJ41-6]|uniref:Sulfotransferase n=1 Tax=Ruegeria spongiae TaxID=2942209 RepID=A0ABT0Q616_9RHOB|nr:sulfotransferase domain-containing protein [Ruegeria spongiae]MCL6285255.1 sulfotransferase [Ruegeria spongiae]
MRGYCLCIGAAKSGTTWLYEQLLQAPEIYMAPEKELHYFFSRFGDFNRLRTSARYKLLREFVERDSANFEKPLPEPVFSREFGRFQKKLDWYQMFAQGPVTQSWYRRLFLEAGKKQLACDFSPSTSKISVEGVHAIRELSENVKIIYILRDPVERLWSHIKYHAEYIGCFDEVKNYSPEQLVQFARADRLNEDGCYGTYLTRFLEVFDREDVLVLDFGELKSNPVVFMERVSGFLGIDSIELQPTAANPVNVSAKMEMPDGLLDEFKPEMIEQIGILEDLGYPFASKWNTIC